jgi:beta-alanine degradation protein BauB
MNERSAKANRLIENEKVIVTEWVFAPGEATGFHVHQHDYVVVPLTTGRLRIVTHGEPASDAELVTGVPYARSAGVAHNVISVNAFEFRFIEVEIK